MAPDLIDNPERALAVRYAPAAARGAVTALWQLDQTLAGIVRAAREPIIGQMRLTWWHDALLRLDEGAIPPNPPLLAALGGETVRAGIVGQALAAMIDGWEALLADPLDEAAMQRFGDDRGARLFAATARLCGADAAPWIAQAGAGWALADLSVHLSDPAAAARARQLAEPLAAAAARRRWPARLRMLGALVHLAQLDLQPARQPPGAPIRVARMLWHRLSGW